MSNTAEFPLLSLIMFTPLAGAVILLFVNKNLSLIHISEPTRPRLI